MRSALHLLLTLAGAFVALVSSRAGHGACASWCCGQWCCDKAECRGCRICTPPPPPVPLAPPQPPSPPAPPSPPRSGTSVGMYWSAALRTYADALEGGGVEWSHAACIGELQVAGGRRAVAIRNSGAHPHAAAPARVLGAALQLRLLPRDQSKPWIMRNGARVYLADPTTAMGDGATTTCDRANEPAPISPAAYRGMPYSAWHLLGKTLSFTVDLSAAECGCNAAVYLVPMRSNAQAGNCGGDFYCDANEVCGVRCDEIDLLEANLHAIHATAHTADDGGGHGNGLGGVYGTTAFGPDSYGPGAAVIDTRRPFRVSAFFDTDPTGERLTGIEMTLLGESGGTLSFGMASKEYLGKITPSLRQGLTPTFSYWSSDELGWLEGGVCDAGGSQDACGEVLTVSHVEVHHGRTAPPPPATPASLSPADAGGEAGAAGGEGSASGAAHHARSGDESAGAATAPNVVGGGRNSDLPDLPFGSYDEEPNAAPFTSPSPSSSSRLGPQTPPPSSRPGSSPALATSGGAAQRQHPESGSARAADGARPFAIDLLWVGFGALTLAALSAVYQQRCGRRAGEGATQEGSAPRPQPRPKSRGREQGHPANDIEAEPACESCVEGQVGRNALSREKKPHAAERSAMPTAVRPERAVSPTPASKSLPRRAKANRHMRLPVEDDLDMATVSSMD